MNGIDEFVTLLRDELGMAVTREDLGKHLDQVTDWDSVHLLELLTVLERDSGRSISLPHLMTASSLAEIYELTVAGTA